MFGSEYYNELRVFDLQFKIELLQRCLGKKSLLSRREKHDIYAKLLASLHEELLTPQEYKELENPMTNSPRERKMPPKHYATTESLVDFQV